MFDFDALDSSEHYSEEVMRVFFDAQCMIIIVPYISVSVSLSFLKVVDPICRYP